MSGILNRAFSLMDSSDASHKGEGDGRNLGNGHSASTSPLKIFGQAKKKINDIFKDIAEYIVESDTFIDDISSTADVITQSHRDSVKGFKDKVSGIIEVLSRDKMKVVFFGRTSNGKSTVINAMLKDKILPSGIGHTTSCFLQVEGTDSNEAVMLTEDSDEPKSIDNIKHLAHALSSYKLKESAMIRILWPKNKCRLLSEDVVLVDSPGIDVTPDLDIWIDKFCLDADVFVLVANAESTLMQTEKNFFHKVSSRLSKPNIFILQNRWDVSANEEDIEAVKKQHLERNIQFLVDELHVVDGTEAEDHVFFVSAKETLVSRLHQDRGTPTPAGALQEGFQVRMFEFANFERKFEECISKSAVKTKFDQHTQRGKGITSELRVIMDETFNNSLEKKEERMMGRREKADELASMDKQLFLLTNEIKDKIRAMSEDVERKVAGALNDEIRRLSNVVDAFERPFLADQLLLNEYKKDLHVYVEAALCHNMSAKCTLGISRGVDNIHKVYLERLSQLLPDGSKQQLITSVPKHQFEIAYRLDCRNLCRDFCEDIQFHFSFGLTSLMRKFLGIKGTRAALFGYSDRIPLELLDSDVPSNELMKQPSSQDSEMLMSVLSTFASLTSRSTVGAIVIAGVITKAAGWRVIAISGGIYGLLYLYERLTWTNRAKERSFKQQYVDYASSKLRLIVDLTSSNCSHQVQQELSSTFARLCHQVDLSKEVLEGEVHELDKGVAEMQKVAEQAKALRNKAGFLDTELNNFAAHYLNET